MEFDLDVGVITLQFSETVNADTFNFTDIVFQSLFTNPTSGVRLMQGSILSENTSTIELTLGQDDLDQIKMDQYVCAYRGNCYISFTSALVEDMNSNKIVPAGDDFPGFIALGYTRDVTRPKLEAFDLDLTNNSLLLSFSEPVDLGSLMVDEIVLQGSDNVSLNSDQLRVEAIAFAMSTFRTIIITLSDSFVEFLKSSQYFKDENSTFLFLSEMTVTDLSFYRNEIVAIPSNESLQVQNFTRDSEGAQLVSFTLDYTTNQLLLTFNEPILPETFDFRLISIGSEPFGIGGMSGGENYTLTGGVIANIVQT